MLKSSDKDGLARPATRQALTEAREPAASWQPPRSGQAGGDPASTPAAQPDTSKPGRKHLTLANLALVLFAVALAAVGQLMLKHGMQVATARATSTRGSLVVSAATSGWVLFGLVVFAVSAVIWLAALSRVPLSLAYPFNALGYLGILTASVLVLHERATLLTWAGTVLVVSGLVIVVLSRP
jgi:drug/metabolite transporter (DMT)-like permease